MRAPRWERNLAKTVRRQTTRLAYSIERLCDLAQRPTAAHQQGYRFLLELIRKMTPSLAHSTPCRSRRSLAKVSTNSGEPHSTAVPGGWPSVSTSTAERSQPALRGDEIDDPPDPVAGLQVGEDKRP